MKNLLLLSFVILLSLSTKGQSHLFFVTKAEDGKDKDVKATFLMDSTVKKKVRKLSKGECLLVENLEPFKKKYLYVTCVVDGKTGFIDKDFLKQEKTYFPDSTGLDPIHSVKKEYQLPYARLMNISKHAIIKLSLLGRTYVIKPGDKQELFVKPGMHRFKVETAGYQPLYTQDTFTPYHIVEVEFYIE